jgi:hypothetical protein
MVWEAMNQRGPACSRRSQQLPISSENRCILPISSANLRPRRPLHLQMFRSLALTAAALASTAFAAIPADQVTTLPGLTGELFLPLLAARPRAC